MQKSSRDSAGLGRNVNNKLTSLDANVRQWGLRGILSERRIPGPNLHLSGVGEAVLA